MLGVQIEDMYLLIVYVFKFPFDLEAKSDMNLLVFVNETDRYFHWMVKNVSSVSFTWLSW